FALTVTYATIFSLIASFTVTPMLASLILPDKDVKKHPIGQKLEAMFHAWESTYQRWIKSMLKSKKRSLAVVLASVVLFVLSLFVAKQVGFEFMPLLDEGDINVEVELPQGYNMDQTAQIVNTIQDRITKHPEVKQVLTTIGSLSELDVGTNLALMRVKLVDASERELSSNRMANLFIKELSDIPNALIRVSPVSSIGSGQAPIQFYLMGQEADTLEQIKSRLIPRIKNIPGLVNLNTSSRAGKPEITIFPDRRKISEAGLTVFDIAMTARAAVEGIVTTRYRESGNEYDIRLKLNDNSVNSTEKIRALTVVSRQGRYRIGQLADIRLTSGYSKILHLDKYKSIEFSGYNAPGHPLGDIVSEINRRAAEIKMPPGYKISWGGSARMMKETAVDMLRTFIIAFVLTYMLLAAILESLTQPLLILGTVPLALIGVFIALIATGQTMNTISMMAIVMLLGIVVNNAILLLDYANILRRRGKNVHDALVEACPTKLKPIIMATIAIILGMAPMALGIGEAGVEFRQPMGIVSIGGLVVSGVLTLFVIPALYHLTTREQDGKQKETTQPQPETQR
ncbi:MAG TPA: efflux RND transporter permease subunit, partial [Caldithrix abyssi]|nr:efflux RND transporter permease subunit [Caldithrix abyssi]